MAAAVVSFCTPPTGLGCGLKREEAYALGAPGGLRNAVTGEWGVATAGDLLVADVAEHRFVRGADDGQVADEMAGGFDGGGGVAGRIGGLAEVLVHVIAVGDDGFGLEGESAVVGSGQRFQGPRGAEGFLGGREELEVVKPGGLELVGVEGPEEAAGVRGLARDEVPVGFEQRRAFLLAPDRYFHQEASIVGGGQNVDDGTRVPCRG